MLPTELGLSVGSRQISFLILSAFQTLWSGMAGTCLYGSGRPYWHYSETINAVTSLKPILRRQVQAAWDLGFAWVTDEPYSHQVAVPTASLLWMDKRG